MCWQAFLDVPHEIGLWSLKVWSQNLDKIPEKKILRNSFFSTVWICRTSALVKMDFNADHFKGFHQNI